ncbi:MAG TPA: hypothetical protein VKY92_05760 [Verrucomicrobiae bacterium]|nr:hypothetical protein [Verrucomicrobiae bacterium]
MKNFLKTFLAMAAVAGFASTASAAVSLTFDAADSNIGAGLYDFLLSGAPSTATLANYNSTFTITGWAAPSIGNNQTIVSTVAPSAWNLTQNDSNNAKWILESTTSPNNVVNGRFEVQAKPNLQGTLAWQFAWPGDNTYTTSGNVMISVVPEPAVYAYSAAAMLLAVLGTQSRRRRLLT